MGSRYVEFLRELGVKVRPRQACVLARVCSCGTNRGPKEF